jgi:hypothetical protein
MAAFPDVFSVACKRYRALALDARNEAERATDRQAKELYLQIAEEWEKSAAEIEGDPQTGRIIRKS